MDDSAIKNTAQNLGMETSDVEAVINEFMLQLHRAQHERNEMKGGDYLGNSQIGALFRTMPRQAFFHFLGFYEFMQRDQAEWEPGYVHEFISRLAPRCEWLPHSHQMNGWAKGNYWMGR